MADIIVENIVKLTAALLLMLIGVLGTYLTCGQEDGVREAS